MKIAVCSQGSTPGAMIDSRFGRCQYLLVYDSEQKNWQTLPAPGCNSGGGAGIETARFLVGQGVQVLLAGHVGPNAMRVLDAAGVQVYTGIEGTVENSLRLYQANRLTRLTAPNAAPHHGLAARV
ncbi:MAG: NifB/NifX family molybdenum-iron cluster-binding protein [Desulfurispora sp.]